MKNFEFLASGSNFAHPAIEMFLFPARTAQRGVSLFSFFKVAADYLALDVDFRSALPIFRKIAMVLYIPILWLAYRLRSEFWKMFAALTIVALLLPHLSGHYKLIHMLIVTLFFVVKEESGRWDFIYAVILGLLLVPKPYFFLERFASDAPGHDLSIAMILDPLLLLGLLLLFFIERPLRMASA